MLALRSPSPSPRTLGAQLLDVLAELGVEQAYGLVGGAIAPLCDALGDSALRSFQLRHEAGALFAACEASLASGRPVAAFVTTGPGLTNALTGALAARWEGARVILISGATSPAQRGRWAVQETTAQTMPSELFSAGPVFDLAAIIESPTQLPSIANRIAQGLARPGGFVAHLSLPVAVQHAPATALPSLRATRRAPAPEASQIDACAELLTKSCPVVWIGHGARDAAGPVRTLVERLGARVMASPRAKGIFSERHPLYLGVTGCGGHEMVERVLRDAPPQHILVLGSKLGEFTSCWSSALCPTESFVHVDVDERVFGAAYPNVPTVGVVADIGEFARALAAKLPERPSAPALSRPTVAQMLRRDEGRVRPRALMQAIQRVVVDGSDALVLAESGNSFAWTNHELVFSEPGRYRVSGLWGSMGHATSGVVGAAMGSGRRAFAVVGDGAMLMMNEVSAAVQYGVRAVWVVLNDGMMGIVDKGMALQGLRPFQTGLPATDFALLARALGATGLRVEAETVLDRALETALQLDGPVVIDVHVAPTELAPIARRISALAAMGASRN